MICPVQRSCEGVKVASMLDILARLKTSTFGMWPFHEIRMICRRCQRCTLTVYNVATVERVCVLSVYVCIHVYMHVCEQKQKLVRKTLTRGRTAG